MKLNKYIYSKLVGVDVGTITEEDIEDWITEWYMDTFQEMGCDGDLPKPRGPPLWLAGPRWYDRKRRKEEEARALIEQERCGIDEG